MALTENQNNVLKQLGFPTNLAACGESQLDVIEDAISDELQLRGIESGEKLNDYGEDCRAILIQLASIE